MTLINRHKVRRSTAALMWILFFVFTILVKNIDVKAIGPSGSMVGFASLNGAVAGLFGYNELFYKLSGYLGYLALLVDAAFALLALLQWITRKRLGKIDKNLLYLMFFYALIITLYIAFMFVVVNYRPVILPDEGGLESSYPSSHTMLAVASCYTAVLNLPTLLRKEKSRKIIGACLTVLGLLVIVGRILSGVHWFTDIFGALILVSAAIMTYLAALTDGKTGGRYSGKRVAK